MLRIKLVAAVIAASSLVAPALADKANNAIRFANDQVLENVDPYFNNVRIGFILAHQVWDTLIYRDPRTGQYSGQLATGWRWLDDKTSSWNCAKASNSTMVRHSMPTTWCT